MYKNTVHKKLVCICVHTYVHTLTLAIKNKGKKFTKMKTSLDLPAFALFLLLMCGWCFNFRVCVLRKLFKILKQSSFYWSWPVNVLRKVFLSLLFVGGCSWRTWPHSHCHRNKFLFFESSEVSAAFEVSFCEKCWLGYTGETFLRKIMSLLWMSWFFFHWLNYYPII